MARSDTHTIASTNKISSARLGHIAAISAAAFWGTAYVGAKFAMQSMPPLSAAFYRFLIASLITWPVLWLTGGIKPVPKSTWKDVFGTALFNTTFYFAVQYTGLRFTSASNTALIVNTRPLILAFLAVLLFKERFTLTQWIAMFVAFSGVVLIVQDPAANTAIPNHIWGDLLIVLNAIIGAWGMIFSKRALRVLQPFTLLVYQITIGAIGLLPMAWIESHGTLFDLSQVAWGPILFLAVVCTAIAQMLMNIGLANLPVTITGAYLFLIPIMNTLFAFTLLGEPVTWMLVLGGTLILGGTYLVNHAHAAPAAAGK